MTLCSLYQYIYILGVWVDKHISNWCFMWHFETIYLDSVHWRDLNVLNHIRYCRSKPNIVIISVKHINIDETRTKTALFVRRLSQKSEIIYKYITLVKVKIANFFFFFNIHVSINGIADTTRRSSRPSTYEHT